MDLHGMLMQISLIGVITSTIVATTAAEAALAKPDCDYMCGEVKIPYPFGLTDGCYLNEKFYITCEDNVTAKTGKLTVKSISIDDHELRVLNFVAHRCYNKTGGLVDGIKTRLTTGRYTISNTKNKFTVVGCDTYAYLTGTQKGENYSIGCMSLCNSLLNVVNGSCSGVGCCEVEIPDGLKSIQMKVRSYDNHTDVWDFNPCGYAFVAERGRFDFSSAYLKNLTYEELPMVLEWAIGNETCKEAAQNKTAFACKTNSYCQDLETTPGYRCKCERGYQGNPYLPDGCRDINECEDPNLNNCTIAKHCVNTPGNYSCRCPKWHHGSGRKDGEGCEANLLLVFKIAIGIGISFITMLVGSTWLYLIVKKRKLIRLKEKFFKQNGGLILEQLRRQEGSTETTKIFTEEELKKATSNYNESRIIGQGGFGTVYKGVLPNTRVVAIKKSKTIDQSQIQQFINEVFVLSQINHRNVVKLLGCCLETPVPLLVYEFITNDTLFKHLHHKSNTSVMPWQIRLKIAAETAEALAYLHSEASTPIIHRDIKSTNILLDDKYTAKVSDFGASKLVPLDQTQLATMVQGTLGYLDPEYLLTSQLTEKSDVYSFGVVLVELLTGEEALSFSRSEQERSVAMHFLCSLKEERLFDVLDDHVVEEGNKEQLKEVAELAKSCLTVKGEERPTMKDVAMELAGIRKMEMHPWVDVGENLEETEHLLGETSGAYKHSSGSKTTGYDSMNNHVILALGDGR
nr:putative wall-associated receptor kinase-like 16 [Quercus suber]